MRRVGNRELNRIEQDGIMSAHLACIVNEPFESRVVPPSRGPPLQQPSVDDDKFASCNLGSVGRDSYGFENRFRRAPSAARADCGSFAGTSQRSLPWKSP